MKKPPSHIIRLCRLLRFGSQSVLRIPAAVLALALFMLGPGFRPGPDAIPGESISSGGRWNDAAFLESIQDTGVVVPRGGLSRRARAEISRSARKEDTAVVAAADTTSPLQRIRTLPRDSSARVAQLRHVRRDPASVLQLRRRNHPLFLSDPLVLAPQSSLDSARWSYRVRRVAAGGDVRVPVDLTLDEYREFRLRGTIRKNWEELAQKYQFEEQKKVGLGDLFGQVTNIEIPVPPNPLFSIFGPNIIRLQINGSVDIHGAFRSTKSDQQTFNPLDQVRNEPDFNQEVQVSVKGEIGDKLKIDADWNTQRTFEYENQLRVRYTGYEDEIVQSVEAGNVSLATNSTFISSSQALFGIKAGFQLGPLKLTTIASQKKGEIKELTVSGGGRPTPFQRRAHEYSRDHFFVDVAYRNLYDRALKTIPLDVNPDLEIRDMEVWVSRTGNQYIQGERQVVAFMDVDSVRAYQGNPAARAGAEFTPVPGRLEIGTFVKLTERTDYTYDNYLGYLSPNRSLQNDQVVAVAFTLPSLDIGTFDAKDSEDAKDLRLILKLVRPKNLDPSMKPAWDLMLKNIYPLGGRGIKKDGFDMKLEYEAPGRTPEEIVTVEGKSLSLKQMLRVDRYNESGSPEPDAIFDYFPGITVNEMRGELIFPTLEPFGRNIQSFFLETFGAASPADSARALALADSFVVREVYDTTFFGASNSRKNNFYIRGTITSAIASSYNVGFNVVEGSVEVLVDGERQRVNVDYTVDYLTGQVVIKNQSLLVPGRNLQIKYEANDLFQLASKSLLGARGELALAKNTNFGFTILNLNQQTLSDKVRLGEEPVSNTIFGIDGGWNYQADFLTRAMNWLPGIQTNAPSTLAVRGEAAYMLPDPNTRKSNIGQDGGQGIAYIDDFEGARRTIPLGISFGSWREASPPAFIRRLDTPSTVPDSTKMEYKSRLVWYNILPSDVRPTDIWPEKEVRQGEDYVVVLNLHYLPKQRGAFNTSLDLNGKLFANPDRGWGGVMKMLGTTATNLVDENISFIEFWVNVERTRPTAKLNIDLGFISEDVIPNGRLDTEEPLRGGIRDGRIEESEDVGLDGLSNEEERVVFADFIRAYPEYEADPSGDDYVAAPYGSINPDRYAQANVNGTEGNIRSEGGFFANTEDLNMNNALDRTNSYFQYEIPLDTTHPGFQKYVAGNNNTGWFQIRIPINDTTRSVGQPSFTNVEAMRVWFSEADDEVLLRIAEFNLVGNQWEAVVKNDENFRVSVVNADDNPQYTLPPGVSRPVDRNRPDQVIRGNEQSLALLITGLADGGLKQAVRRFSTRPLDLFNYRTMKMFVHGSRGLTYVDTTNYDLDLVFRFGADSLSYYEYRAPIRPGWEGNDVTIRFEDVTAIKLGRDSARALSARVPVPDGPSGATYQVRGEPTLTNVRYLSIGVENPPNKGPAGMPVSGEVWINELRLTEVDDTPGWAYRFESSVKLADVATVSFGMSQRNPFFHGLEDRFGSRNSDRNWSLSGNIDLAKFLPDSWRGTALSVNYSHVETVQDPRYLPGTDILVDEAVNRLAALAREQGADEENAQRAGELIRDQNQALSVTETYSVPNLKLNVPVDSWLVTETINRMNFGYSFTQSRRRNPTTQSFHQWSWNFRFGYGLQFGLANFVEPFKPVGDFVLFSPWKTVKLFYTPRNVNVSTTFNRGQTREQVRVQNAVKPVARTFTASRSMSFNWQLVEGGLLNPGLDYTLDVASSLVHFDLDPLGRKRSFGEILGDIFGGARLIDFGIDLNYGQNININTRPAVPALWGLNRLISPTARYSVRYDWQNNLQAGALGKSSGWSNNLSLSMDLNIKTLGNEIWSAQPAKPAAAPADTAAKAQGKSLLEQIDAISRVLIKTPFFEFDRLSVTYTQTNNARHSGILGRPGFLNLFGTVPFFQEADPLNGPSALYQLGLASDPHGRVILRTKGTFPFVTGTTVPGLRAPLGNLTDVFSQSNRVNMRTSRPLWEGARIDLTWNYAWSYNVNRSLVTDSLGVPSERNRIVNGDIDRSFLTFPDILFFKIFKTNLESVNKLYEELKRDVGDTRSNDQKLTQAFQEGLEAIPFGAGFLGIAVPRPNWTIRWDGLEKLSFLSGFMQRVSLDHSYSSGYKRRWKLTPTGGEVTESQQITYGFSPLIGVSVTFKPLGKGNLGANFRYSSTTSLDLSPAAQNVVEGSNDDFSLTANYSRQGFEIPFFGLSLSNDLDVSFSYSLSMTKRRIYDMKGNFRKEGEPLEGFSRTTMEPRIRYILSARVTASIYYKYTRFKPDEGGSKIPGSTINEGGLDVRVAIQ